ncbi:fructose transport system substrate-binding protein [Herbihabitans rhizosphaerae]|uniref:Fructose transport system substrate-binding protein n=1 Tax=Herbihabitans rhizosphaerae TaxID=1872711 RepID=A0A4Q7KLD8_9PSEU|nr:substrate-binding domain-containing protein [Herbihabitans rhizosphaerae]RZS37067.1 fructose transport system substrate-binding protein [Herbihabitans rhizosphaerae]
MITRTTRRALALAVAAGTALAMGTACTATKQAGASGPTDGPVKLGLVTKTDSNPYFVSMRSAAEQEASAKGATVIAKAGKEDGDNDSQVKAVEDLIAAGVRAIMITPSDTKAIVPVLKKAQQKNILVIALDTQTDGNQGVDATFATDNTQAGVLQGQYVKAALGQKQPRVALLDLQPGVTVGDQRHNGFLKGIGLADSAREISGRGDTNGDQGKGQTAMENLLQRDSGINAVYTINEPAAIGAFTAIKNAGKADGVVIGSIDGGCTGVQAVKEGQIAATVMQFPGKMARLGVAASVEFAKSGAKPQVPTTGYIDTGVQLVTDKPLGGLDAKDTAWGAQNCWGKK